jgi:outer membrane lipoprotein-sorting protein
MRLSPALNAAVLLSLLVCFVIVPTRGSSETLADLSKRMNDRCGKFNEIVRDITLTMEMANPSSEGALTTQTVFYQKGRRFRAEMTMTGLGGDDAAGGMADLKVIVVSDGTSVWIVNPMTGKSQIPPGEGRKYRGQWYCEDYIPANAEIVGSESVGGHDCHVLAVKDEKSDYAKLWIDKKSLVLVKSEATPQEGETTVTLFSDFRKITSDIELPYKTELYSGADLISTILMKSVEVNKGLADGLFDPDKVKIGPSLGEKKKVQLIKPKKIGVE